MCEANLPDLDTLIEAIANEENLGFCLVCGHWQGQCEPDARHYVCENCHLPQVFGAEELIFMVDAPEYIE